MGAEAEGLLPSQKTVKMISTHLLINMFRHKYSPGHDILQISRALKYYKLVLVTKFKISKFQNFKGSKYIKIKVWHFLFT